MHAELDFAARSVRRSTPRPRAQVFVETRLVTERSSKSAIAAGAVGGWIRRAGRRCRFRDRSGAGALVPRLFPGSTGPAARRPNALARDAGELPQKDDRQTDAADARRGPGEVLVDERRSSPTASKICAPQ